ncbi:MAG TPA: pyridoxamine 5'-phosphate oxidase [Xanthobacteraceae bacterium]|nr:pyridoxamine 5'-phosphate oxidase [Xanthobacteraceae bacterium]
MKHPAGLTFSDFPDAAEPFGPFEAWMAEAKTSEPRDPDAIALATVDADGMPNVRMVLLKGWGPEGFIFYTNRESAKGRELEGQGKAALVIYWKSLSRQVRVRGPVSPVTSAQSDAYFGSRARGAQVGAWASQQSRPLKNREELQVAVTRVEAQYEGKEVPRPPHWIGYRIAPLYVEFWQEQPFRLHDRVVFSRAALDRSWTRSRLYP